MRPIFKSTGIYVGFILNGALFSRDGDYLGWLEGNYVWDAKSGRFRGQVWNDKYITVDQFAVQPLPKQTKAKPATPPLPHPPPNISPVALPTGWIDSF